MKKIKDLIIKYVLRDYLKDFIKPIVEKILKFLDGKKTLLSLILFGAAAYAKSSPQSLVSQIILEIVAYVEGAFSVPITLDGMEATAIIGAILGTFDKLRKWSVKK